jgi:ribonuclease PH
MNEGKAFIEVQGTAESQAFRRDELNAMLELAEAGIGDILRLQREALGE